MKNFVKTIRFATLLCFRPWYPNVADPLAACLRRRWDPATLGGLKTDDRRTDTSKYDALHQVKS